MKFGSNKFLMIGIALLMGLMSLFLIAEINQFMDTKTALGQYWPFILVIIGLMMIQPGSSQIGVPLGIVGLGLVLFMFNAGIFDSSAGRYVAILIFGFGGILMLALAFANPTKRHQKAQMKASQKAQTNYPPQDNNNPNPSAPPPPSTHDRIVE